MRPHGRLRGRHHGVRGPLGGHEALSSRPFCSCDGRQVGLWYLAAGYRYTTLHRRRLDLWSHRSLKHLLSYVCSIQEGQLLSVTALHNHDTHKQCHETPKDESTEVMFPKGLPGATAGRGNMGDMGFDAPGKPLVTEAQPHHCNHEPHTVCHALSSNALWLGHVLGHRERLIGVREAKALLTQGAREAVS